MEISKSKTWLFEKFNKIDKLIGKLPREKKRGMKPTNTNNKNEKYRYHRGDFNINQHIVKEYYDQFQIYTFNNLGEIDQFVQGLKYLK